MSIVYDFADIAARMNHKPEPVKADAVEVSAIGWNQFYSPSGLNDVARQIMAGRSYGLIQGCVNTSQQTLRKLYQAGGLGDGDCTFNLPDYRVRL